MIVVPPFPEDYQRDQQVVPRSTVRSSALIRSGAPQMADRVNQPKRMQERDAVQKTDPNQETECVVVIKGLRTAESSHEATYDERAKYDRKIGNIIVTLSIHPQVELVIDKIRHQPPVDSLFLNFPSPFLHPTEVDMPNALLRGMGVFPRNVRMDVVQPMHRRPKDWTSLNRQIATPGDKVLKPFRYGKGVMREQPVVANCQP